MNATITVRMPTTSPGPFLVLTVFVKAGEHIQRDQRLIEFETDKAVCELPSPIEGVVEDVLISVGQQIDWGSPLIVLRKVESA